jgi:hypothetical protein
MRKTVKIIQWTTTTIVFILLVANILKWDKIQVNGTTIALIGLLLVVPLIEFIRKIRIGEFEAEIGLKEVEKVKAKASEEFALLPEKIRYKSDLHSQIVDLVKHDPQLGLAKLRMELENVLRALFNLCVDERRFYPPSLKNMIDKLAKGGHIPKNIASPLNDVISLANRAVHGESVRRNVAEDLALLGIQILEQLKNYLREKAVNPIKSDLISSDEVERFQSLKYRVTTIIPLVEGPTRNVYLLKQDELEDFLEGYFEYAEFIVGIEPVESE